MDTEINSKWVERLRSGDILQGTGRLHHSETGAQCCLGVLCEMAADAGIVDRYVDNEGARVFYGPKGSNPKESGVGWEGSILPKDVISWAGMHSSHGNPDINPVFVPRMNALGQKIPGTEREISTLAGANDGGKTFAEIADIIENEAKFL